MNPDTIHQYCDQIDTIVQQIRDEVGPPPVPIDDLQAALDAGGTHLLPPNTTFEAPGGFSYNTPSTNVTGQSENLITGRSGHAVRFGLDFHDGVLSTTEVSTTDYDGSILRLGLNTTDQTELARVPHSIRLSRVDVASHRGKRAIEVNAANVLIENCSILDVYAPSKQDSQAILIVNTPGGIHIHDCYLEAASENIMVGGDEMKLPDTRPTGITIESCQLTKPLIWQGNPAIPVKNLLELKDGHDVTIRNCTLWNSWKSGQDGYCFMFTPTRGGSLRNVLVEDCTVHDVGAIVNITGFDSNWPTPHPRTQVTFNGGSYTTNKAAMGGTGRFALLTRGPELVVLQNLYVRHEGSAFIECGDSQPIDTLHILNCDFNYGQYGIRIGGQNHGDNSLGIIQDLRIENCTITGAHSLFRDRYPQNTYV